MTRVQALKDVRFDDIPIDLRFVFLQAIMNQIEEPLCRGGIVMYALEVIKAVRRKAAKRELGKRDEMQRTGKFILM